MLSQTPVCFLISVDSASKKAYCFLKLLDCFLISVDHALISVDSASKKAYCFLKLLECLLISVDHALISVEVQHQLRYSLMSKSLYFVRHCRAAGQEPDAPLTAEGHQQAIALVDLLYNHNIERIVSSPFVRAYQSIAPLAEGLGLDIEIDERLAERVMSSTPLADWQKRLAETFLDLDLCLEGGESSRTAMMRGVAVVSEVLQQAASTIVIVTHGNLMTLILKHFNDHIGYTEWQQLSNPDVYRVHFFGAQTHIERLSQSLSSVDF